MKMIRCKTIKKIQDPLARYTNSVNQIAKCVNSTSVIYNDDIKDLKNQIEHLSKEIWQIHSLLLDRTSNKDDV